VELNTASAAFGLDISAQKTTNSGGGGGLLGVMDGDPANDLRALNGTTIPTDSSLERIHNEFGLSWAVTERDSIFDYLHKSFSFYNAERATFRPNFGFVPTANSTAAARNVCGAVWACLYDFESTGGDAEMAAHTLEQIKVRYFKTKGQPLIGTKIDSLAKT
jgi:hypothetical protein